jgi:hypothetical protein
MEDSSPNMNCSELWIVQFVAKHQLKDEDWEHENELRRVSELSVENLVSHDDNFVQNDE